MHSHVSAETSRLTAQKSIRLWCACGSKFLSSMGISMRTTLDLPDDILKRAKIAAVRRGSTLRDLVAEGLRRVLENDVVPKRKRMTKAIKPRDCRDVRARGCCEPPGRVSQTLMPSARRLAETHAHGVIAAVDIQNLAADACGKV
jgi:hypothetical protein